MNKENKTPLIRFKGFSDDWEQRKLEEIYDFKYGEFNNNPDNGGQYPIYGANGIIGGYTNYNAESSSVIGHMGAYAGYVVWAEGKHFVTYNGTIAKPSTDFTDSKFGFYLLSQKEIYKICAGSGQPFVSYNDLNGIEVEIPAKKEEQVKIAEYFSNLDNLITLHQRKCESLKKVKKSMLQKMFPKNGESVPEIRFAGFTDAWEQRKLEEIYDFKYGEFNNNPDNGGQYPIYGANGIIGGYTNYNAESSSVIGHMGAYAGYVVWAEGKHFVTYNGTIAKPSTDFTDSKFGFYLLSQKEIYKICAGSGQPFVSYNDLNGIEVEIPAKKEEQVKIAEYFSNLDNLITLHQRKVEKLKNLKKSMLQKMFV